MTTEDLEEIAAAGKKAPMPFRRQISDLVRAVRSGVEQVEKLQSYQDEARVRALVRAEREKVVNLVEAWKSAAKPGTERHAAYVSLIGAILASG